EGIWQNIATLQRHVRSHDDRIDALVDANQATHDDIKTLQARVIEIDDASMLLEERIDNLASNDSDASRALRTASLQAPRGAIADSSDTQAQQATENSGSQAWTVHVSLLPGASQPFPFEKDTIAYNRALSRGL